MCACACVCVRVRALFSPFVGCGAALFPSCQEDPLLLAARVLQRQGIDHDAVCCLIHALKVGRCLTATSGENQFAHKQEAWCRML